MGPNRLLHITCQFGLDSSISSGSFPLLGILTRLKSGSKKERSVKKPNVKKISRYTIRLNNTLTGFHIFSTKLHSLTKYSKYP